MVGPVVNDLCTVHPQAYAVVTDGAELICAGRHRLCIALPTHAEGVRANPGDGSTGSPVEVHRRIRARLRCAGEVGVIVVRGRETGTGEQATGFERLKQ